MSWPKTEQSDGVVMIVVVVEHVPSTMDKLTGEELILMPNFLCKAAESDTDKKANKNTMMQICKDFKVRG